MLIDLLNAEMQNTVSIKNHDIISNIKKALVKLQMIHHRFIL